MQNFLQYLWDTLSSDYKSLINNKRHALMLQQGATVLAPLEQLADARISRYKAKPVVSLECSCCGAITIGRQWHNRDNGYGLCSKCASRYVESASSSDISNYGLAGIHYDINRS